MWKTCEFLWITLDNFSRTKKNRFGRAEAVVRSLCSGSFCSAANEALGAFQGR